MDGQFWNGALQLGAVAVIFLVFLVLLYRLADKYLAAWTKTSGEARQAEIESHKSMAESMQQITMTMQQTSEFHNNNIREVLLAVKVVSEEVSKMMEMINGLRNTKA